MWRHVPGRSLALAPWVLAACGSRTPLLYDPAEDNLPQAVSTTTPISDAAAPPLFPCITGTRPVREVHIDLSFMLDKSKSMNSPVAGSSQTRWQAVASALDSFLNSPLSAGLGAGISFFPRQDGGRDRCLPSDYKFPFVDIATLPDNAASIRKAIAVQTLLSGTPMTPALEGAHINALEFQTMHSSDTLAVVLVTDGIPHDCSSSVATTAAVAATHLGQSPSIKTYVLGVGPSLGSLNAIASAGGTSGAYLVDRGGESSLLAALEAIRTSALACEFVFPPGTNTRFELATVTTQTGVDAGPTSVTRVQSAEACMGGPGWFYDNSGGQPLPTKITLCPDSCKPLVEGIDSHLDVRVGCVDDDP
jgi:hypothetical protein